CIRRPGAATPVRSHHHLPSCRTRRGPDRLSSRPSLVGDDFRGRASRFGFATATHDRRGTAPGERIQMRQPMPNSRQGGREPELSRDATVSSEYLRLFASAAETRGLDVGPIFAASGINRAILGRRGARIGARAAAEVWKRASRRLSDPLFGLTVADAIPIGALSLMDYLVMSSADVGDALGRVVRYAPLMSDAERLTLTAHGH